MVEFCYAWPIEMTCPSCGLENPPSAQYCDCGYEFVPGGKPKDWTPAQQFERPALFTLKHLVRSWAIGVVTVLGIVALSSVVPSVFWIFIFPLWILPAIAGLGDGDHVYPLMLLGGSLFYGGVSFLILGLVHRRRYLKR